MKHIRLCEDWTWDHRPYWSYLESVRPHLPQHLYEFASNVENHDLTSHSSLHDAWLEQLSIREIPEVHDKQFRSIEISTSYLGPFRDLRIRIEYRRVAAYEFRTPVTPAQVSSSGTGHRDLLVHEVRLAEGDDTFEHEIIFDRGSVFLIRFHDFKHWIEPLMPADGANR